MAISYVFLYWSEVIHFLEGWREVIHSSDLNPTTQREDEITGGNESCGRVATEGYSFRMS